MWYILDIQGEVFTLSKGGLAQFTTTVNGASSMNIYNLMQVLQTFCDTQDASNSLQTGDLSQLIGMRIGQQQ